MPRKLNILISAYACEPNKGSEPAVGWNWVNEIANRGHKIKVITRKNNQQVIEKVLLSNTNITFEYYDFTKFYRILKSFLGINIYYFLWQIGIFFKVKKIIKQENIDFIHHITFVSIKKYSFLGLLDKPFYYGPAGGGEESPKVILSQLSLKYKIIEFVRSALNSWVKYNPLSYLTFKDAKRIFTTSSQSLLCIPKTFQPKCSLALAIGVHSNTEEEIKITPIADNLKFLYVGQFLYWKGIYITLHALHKFKNKGYNFSFTLVGKGKYEKELKKVSKKLGLTENLIWINWVNQDDLVYIYKSHDIFLYPSLHDSGGMVVLEAMSNGLPSICLNVGGPSYFTSNDTGFILNTNEVDFNLLVDNYVEVLEGLKPSTLKEKSIAAYVQAKKFSWKNTVQKVYSIIEQDFMLSGDK